MSLKNKGLIGIIFIVIILLFTIILKVSKGSKSYEKNDSTDGISSRYVKYRDIELDLKNTTVQIVRGELNKNNLEVVYCFSYMHCSVCVHECLRILNQESNIANNISVVGFFENNNMKVFLQRKYPNLKILDEEDFFLDGFLIEGFSNPVFLEISEGNRIINAFVPDKNHPHQIKKYIEKRVMHEQKKVQNQNFKTQD